MDQLKEAAQKLKEKITNNPLEKLLNEATADVNWNASNKILQEIADHTYSFGDFTEVMKFIWKKLASERKQWRKILKTLSLIEYLVKNGSPRCVQEFKSEIYLIRTLQDFSHYEDGQDRGAAIREVSKRVVQLLNDDAKIDEERKKAQEIRERLGTMGATGSTGAGRTGSTGSYGGFSNKDSGKGSSYGGGSYGGYGGSSSGSGDVKKTKDWRVEKNEKNEEPQRNRETEKEEGYVTKTGTKYEAPEIKNDREEEQASKNAAVRKFAPPKGMKAAPVQQQQQQQQQVDLFEVDAPAPVQQETMKATAAPVNNNAGFEWDAPQAAPQKSDNIWNWDQGQQQGNAQPTQPSAPNQGGFNWNQAPAQPTQPTNVQNLYQQQQPQPTNQFGQGGFNFNAAPQQNNNMNNLSSQLNNLNFNTTPAYNFGGNAQPTQPAQPTTNVANLLSSSPPTKTDGFDDFQTAKNTGPNVNEYKNYSQQEKSIIDLSDFSVEANKKQTQKEKIEVSKNSNEGFLYSSKDELDNFFVPTQPINNMNMGGGFNQGMMNQGMRNMGGMGQMGGMQNMGGMPQMGGMGQMGGMPQMGMGQMGGMQNMGGMPQMGGMGQMGGMPQMGMNMGYQNMGMGQNPGFNPGMMNMQGNFGNQQQMGGFGYR